MRRVLFLLLFVPLCANAFDFKGVVIGAPATPELINEKLGVSCGVGFEGIQVCNGTVTIARESARMNLVISSTGVVRRINLTLSPAVFDVIAPLLVEKFGPPEKIKRGEVQNRMGAKFDQVEYYWQNSTGHQVIYEKYAGSLDSTTLNFSTREDREKLQVPKASRKNDL